MVQGRFWKEWVIGRKNKPGEQREKNVTFDFHLETWFGDMAFDDITTSEVAKFRALVSRGERHGINNILTVLSKALRYAVDCELLVKAPKIGMLKIELLVLS